MKFHPVGQLCDNDLNHQLLQFLCLLTVSGLMTPLKAVLPSSVVI